MVINHEEDINSEERNDFTGQTRNQISTNSRKDLNPNSEQEEINLLEGNASDPQVRTHRYSEVEVKTPGNNWSNEEFLPLKRRWMK